MRNATAYNLRCVMALLGRRKKGHRRMRARGCLEAARNVSDVHKQGPNIISTHCFAFCVRFPSLFPRLLSPSNSLCYVLPPSYAGVNNALDVCWYDAGTIRDHRTDDQFRGEAITFNRYYHSQGMYDASALGYQQTV